MRIRRFQALEYKTEAIGRKALEFECKDRSENELKFLAVHGYWPEGRRCRTCIESWFTTHGLKTTVIVERVEPLGKTCFSGPPSVA